VIPYLLAFLIGCACGMIPFSFLLGLSRGKDIRKIGSGNIGATNLYRALGPVYFIAGFILDGVKGLIPVLLCRAWQMPASLAAVGAILGHIFNPFFNFRGGKGVSTIIGAALGLTLKSFLIGLAAWLAVYLASFFVSLASVILAVALPVAAFALHEGSLLDRILIALLGILIVIAHRSNIRRIFRGEEPKTVLWKKK
jgi:glycerol-3-phosphate acyltransferase PlsY